MVIYKFSKCWFVENRLFDITEIEVEEKPKSYIGKGVRVSKNDIDKLQGKFSCRMYRLDNDPKPYIEAIIRREKISLECLGKKIKEKKAELEKWEILQMKEGAAKSDAKEI